MMSANTFLYFAYGSNLLMKRIHINNPSASRAGIARLKVRIIYNILNCNPFLFKHQLFRLVKGSIEVERYEMVIGVIHDADKSSK